jgi:hypothetical protein
MAANIKKGNGKKKKTRNVIKDSKENLKLQEIIKDRANYSLAILGMMFVYHGSGRFLWIDLRPSRRIKRKK